MVLGAHIGQAMGLQIGSYLGRQLVLGACRDDRQDDLDRRPFTPRVASASLPGAVDLRPWMAPVEDQGQLGSCTANALVGALEYVMRRERGEHVDLSRLFVYYNQRLWDDCVPDDIGASVADGVRVLSRLGVPREASWPYQRDLFGVQPPGAVYREAARFLVSDYWSVPVDADAFRGCLAAGFPIVFGTRVTDSFVHTTRDGMCGMPRGQLDRKHGRHALLAVGYEDRRRLFVVRNSWGAHWGDRGYVYMPYEYVLNREWTSGCWAVRLTSGEGFDPREHAAVDLRSVPRSPPAGSGGAAVVGGAAAIGAQAVVGAFTGSGLLAGLAGGLVAGVAPGVSRALSKRRGAFADQDRSELILSLLRGSGAPGPALAPLPWDDGYDEEAVVRAIDPSSAERRVRTSPRAGGAAEVRPAPSMDPPRARRRAGRAR
ncbi:MAG: C1 family peptidase [Sandaracinaceae bacterium]|nr:C1 family peptidase [Sandaracinaceae bacterium]